MKSLLDRIPKALRDSFVETLIAVPAIYLVICLLLWMMTLSGVSLSISAVGFTHTFAPYFGVLFFIVSLTRSLFNASLPPFFFKKLGAFGLVLTVAGGSFWGFGHKAVFGDKADPSDTHIKLYPVTPELQSLHQLVRGPSTKDRDQSLKAMADWVSAIADDCLDKAVVQIGRKRYYVAKEILLKCLEEPGLSDSTREEILSYLGLVSYRVGDYRAADTLYSLALERTSHLPRTELLVDRALSLIRLGDSAEARSLWTEVVETAAGQPCFPYLEGLWIFEQGNTLAAKPYFESAMANCSEHRDRARLYLDIIGYD